MKVVNPDYQELKEVPIDIELRDKVGISLELSMLEEVNASVDKLLNTEQFAKSAMEDLRNYYIYNIGNSGKVGAKYIIERLMEKSKKK